MMESEFRRIRKLGEGGMGEVWLVMEVGTRCLYAQKTLRPGLAREKDLQRFRREIEGLSSLRHDNIIRIHGVLHGGTSLGYVMEYCPDGSVLDFVGRNPDKSIVPLILQVAKAASHIHQSGLIHRDIKPQNILIGADQTARLTDFGLVVESDPNRTVLTTSNWVSPGFAPPEQFKDMASVTERGDIFSIGAVWFYLVKGKTFALDQALESQIEDLNPFQRFVLRRALAYDPAERFSSAEEIVRILEDVIENRLEPYFGLTREKRLGEIRQDYGDCYDQEGWIDGWDMMKMASVMTFLKALVRYEDDPQVLGEAKSYLASLHDEAGRIAAEMELDNPGY